MAFIQHDHFEGEFGICFLGYGVEVVCEARHHENGLPTEAVEAVELFGGELGVIVGVFEGGGECFLSELLFDMVEVLGVVEVGEVGGEDCAEEDGEHCGGLEGVLILVIERGLKVNDSQSWKFRWFANDLSSC